MDTSHAAAAFWMYGHLLNHSCSDRILGDEIDTMRQFDPGSQRTIHPLDELLITPAREFIPGKANPSGTQEQEFDEFSIPLIHPTPATILDYLPHQTLVMVDNLSNLEHFGEEVEEQAIKMRAESIKEGTLPEDFPSRMSPSQKSWM